MKFKIHFTWPNGAEDDLVIEEDTIEEIRTEVDKEMKKRGATYGWSGEIK